MRGETVDGIESLRELVDALNADSVNLLLILDANPVYDAPADFDFAKAIRKARQAIHFGLYDDETAELCPWHIPATHYLESWSDARAYDGTAAIVQPLIAPLYDGKTVHEVLSAFIDTCAAVELRRRPRHLARAVRRRLRRPLARGAQRRRDRRHAIRRRHAHAAARRR